MGYASEDSYYYGEKILYIGIEPESLDAPVHRHVIFL